MEEMSSTGWDDSISLSHPLLVLCALITSHARQPRFVPPRLAVSRQLCQPPRFAEVIGNADVTLSVLQELKAMGLTLAIDELRNWVFQLQLFEAVSG